MCAVKRADDIELRAADPESPAVKICLGHYYSELDAVFEGGFDPAQKAYSGTDGKAPPKVYCVLAWAGDEPAGIGFLQWQESDAVVEIKRMWVAKEARGKGLARAILAHLEGKARELGFAAIRLDTNRVLKGAQALYRRSGYTEIGRYSDNPYAHHWFGKRL